MGLLRTLAIIFIIILVFRVLSRFVFPWLLKSFVNKAQRDFEQKRQDIDDQHSQRPEGEVTIKTKPKKGQNRSKDDDGDYVDYEEVD